MSNQIKAIIESLKKLCGTETVPLDQVSELSFEFRAVNEYIENLKLRAKPETAANELLRQILINTLGAQITAEVSYERDFIDYAINEGTGNPVLIELKPFFRLNPKKTALIQAPFKYENHAAQIQKYLRHKNVEYVILTNIHHAFIFNREALIEFAPFKETTLHEILDNYLIYNNLWDTLKRFEDQEIKPDLDAEFFESLKKWFNQCDIIEFKPNIPFSREELIVLFLNKFIFIKTLEDYGLIEYHFIQKRYENYVSQWKPKGFKMVFKNFFREIEEFFQIYYDTELFKSSLWDFIDQREENIQKFKDVFELILGLDNWSVKFGKGLVHYNYRHINEDIFGKAYETWIAENRKDEGIYYTPATITEYMAQKITDALFDPYLEQLKAELTKGEPDTERVEDLTALIQDIKIIDPASGSGSFLIKVLKAVYEKYQIIARATQWVFNISQDNLFDIPKHVKFIQDFRKKYFFESGFELQQISSVILHHIFAVDKDERSLDTAKTNLWKEAVKLNPRIYNYRRLDEDKIHILPNLEMNFICGDSLADIDFNQQVQIISDEFREEIIRLHQIRNQYLKEVYHPEIIEEGLEIKKKIRARLAEQMKVASSLRLEPKNPLFFSLEYFFCFFDEKGNPLDVAERGFSGVISNPPWEAIKPVKKEFAKLGKYEMDILSFNKWFSEQLKNDDEFKVKWQDYTKFYEDYTSFLYGKYSYQSTGDPNFYKFFMERDFQLIHEKGFYCLLVPSGFQTDEGSNKLRKLLIETYSLIELSSFENRGYYDESEKHKIKLFQDVHPQFKFSIIFAQKVKSEDRYSFNAKFYLHDPKDLQGENSIRYDIEKIKKFSPENLCIMEFRQKKDYELCSKILQNKKMLSDTEIYFRREFEVSSNSAYLMPYTSKNNGLTLIEGKNIHQFNSNYSISKYKIKDTYENIVITKEINKIAKEFQIDKKKLHDDFFNKKYLTEKDCYRLIYRRVGRSTDERTLIASISKKDSIIADSLNYVPSLIYKMENDILTQHVISYAEIIFFISLLNSLVLNYYIRNKVSANLSIFFIYELPIAEATAQDKKRIIELGFNLLYLKSNHEDFEDLKNSLNIKIDESKKIEEMRAELEVIIAKNLYHLDKSEWEYLTSTFTYGGASDTKAELDKIIALSREIWDSI